MEEQLRPIDATVKVVRCLCIEQGIEQLLLTLLTFTFTFKAS